MRITSNSYFVRSKDEDSLASFYKFGEVTSVDYDRWSCVILSNGINVEDAFGHTTVTPTDDGLTRISEVRYNLLTEFLNVGRQSIQDLI